ncbi:MAG: hypothetical protein ACERKU_09335, partial [Nitrospirota bacterium]
EERLEMNPSSNPGKRSSPWYFLGITFLLTWIFWIPLVLSGQEAMGGSLMAGLRIHMLVLVTSFDVLGS